jgi:uncharacterized membrane protein (UPF0127 family)
MRRFRFAAVVRLSVEGRCPGLDAWVAGPGTRLLGLAGLPRLPPGKGLLIPRCGSVHTLVMRFEIDVALLRWPPAGGMCDVLAARERVAPGRIAGVPWRGARTTAVLETPAGALAALELEPGVRVRVDG